MPILTKDGKATPFHGDHHPVEVYTARESRNLLGTAQQRKEYQGITYDFTESGIVMNGTCVNSSYSASNYAKSNCVMFLEPGEYWLSNKNSIGKSSFYFSVGLFEGESETRRSVNCNAGGKNRFTVSERTAFHWWITAPAGTWDNVVCEPMLTKGSDSDIPVAYEPYGTVTDTIFKPTNLKKSGTELTFEKSYNHAAEVEVAGKSEQVQLSGKNLLNINRTEVIDKTLKDGTGYGYTRNNLRPFNENQVWFGLTMNNYFAHNNIVIGEIGDDYVRCLSSSSGYGIAYPVKVTAGSKYTVSFENNAEVDASHFGVGFYDESGANLSWVQTKTFTVPANAVWATICMRPAANTEITFKKPQLELGTTATEYEPYCGGMPSPNPDYPQEITSIDSVELVSRGRNMLDVSTITSKFSSSVFTYEGGKIYNTSVNNWAGDYAYFNTFKLHSHSLVFSWRSYANGGVNRRDYAFKPLFKAFDKDMNEITTGGVFENLDGWSDTYNSHYKGYFSARGESNPFKNDGVTVNTAQLMLKDHVAYIQVGLCHAEIDAGVTGYVCDYQLEEGTTANPYEPYHSTASTIDLQGNKIRSLPDGTHDTLFVKRTGECWIDKRVLSVRLDDFKWSKYQRDADPFYYTQAGTITGAMVAANTMQRNIASEFGMVGFTNSTTVTRLNMRNGTILEKDPYGEFLCAQASASTIALPSIDPLPTYWPTTVIYDSEGNDISAFVKVVE